MRKFVRENSLSIVLFSLFFAFLIGLSFTGFRQENDEFDDHSRPHISYTEYLASSSFAEAVFENWESEFLQMGALVILTIWFKQKGSADSKKLRGKEDVDTESRYAIINASSWTNRKKAVGRMLYANSLSIALFTLFLLSFGLHLVSGAAAANEEASLHGAAQLSIIQYGESSRFWFESFQNWQSEFLAVATLLVLSVYLRQRKSPESKPVGATNQKTGS